MQFPDDPVTVEQRARLEQWRGRQFGAALENFTGFAIRNLVKADDLDREIVLAAALQRFVDDDPRRLVQILWVIVDRLGGKAGADMLVDAVGRQHEHVAYFGRERLVVDLDPWVDAQRPARNSFVRMRP